MELGKLRTLWEATATTVAFKIPVKAGGICQGLLLASGSVISPKVLDHVEEGDEEWGRRGLVTWSLSSQSDTRNKPGSSSCHTHSLTRHPQSWERGSDGDLYHQETLSAGCGGTSQFCLREVAFPLNFSLTVEKQH